MYRKRRQCRRAPKRRKKRQRGGFFGAILDAVKGVRSDYKRISKKHGGINLPPEHKRAWNATKTLAKNPSLLKSELKALKRGIGPLPFFR